MYKDKPNIILPLACSYNERGNVGYTATFGQGFDQRKINSVYEPITNAFSGNTTLYLSKRSGVQASASVFGDSGQTTYLIEKRPSAPDQTGPGNFWYFSISGDDIRSSNSSATVTISTLSGYTPYLTYRGLINSQDTLVLQVATSSFAQKTFYTSTVTGWTEILDSNFTGLTHRGQMVVMDGYGFILASDNRIYNSNLNTISTWPSENFVTKSNFQDYAMGLARLNNQIICFGLASMEVFVNAGLSPAPLVRVNHLQQNTGLIANRVQGQRNYYAEVGKRIYFLGTEPTAFYAYDGSRIERVSTPAIEKIFLEKSIYFIGSGSFGTQEAVMIALDHVTTVSQRWLMFFPDYKDWFEWHSDAFIPCNSRHESNRFFGTSPNMHRHYVWSASNNFQDAGTSYQFLHQFKLPSDGTNRKRMDYCGVIADTISSAPIVSVAVSDDNWQTTTQIGTMDLSNNNKTITRCGAYLDRGIVLSYTGNQPIRLEKFIARTTEK